MFYDADFGDVNPPCNRADGPFRFPADSDVTLAEMEKKGSNYLHGKTVIVVFEFFLQLPFQKVIFEPLLNYIILFEHTYIHTYIHTEYYYTYSFLSTADLRVKQKMASFMNAIINKGLNLKINKFKFN